jgi:peptidoglycan/LPS O-acetylase OafA/YrhL
VTAAPTAPSSTAAGRDATSVARSTSAGPRFPHLDALRGLAVVLVIATHAAFQTGRYETGPFAGSLARMDFGVTLFFLLSGFLLFRPWALARATAEPGPATRAYLWRRALRILPAYWLAVVAAMYLESGNDPAQLSAWVRHLTFTQVLGAGHLAHGLTQTWSLSIEVAFYLLLPFLAVWVLGRDGRTWSPRAAVARLVLLELLTVGWLVLLAHSADLQADAAGIWLPAHLGWFAAGMVLAVGSVTLDVAGARAGRGWRALAEASTSVATCWLLALGVFLVAATPVAGPRTLLAPTAWESVSKHVLYGLAATLVLLPLVMHRDARDPARRLLSSRPARWLGEISYGMFLYHLVVLTLVFDWTGREPFTGQGFLPVFGATLGVTVLVSAASYVLVERRILRWKGRVRS